MWAPDRLRLISFLAMDYEVRSRWTRGKVREKVEEQIEKGWKEESTSEIESAMEFVRRNSTKKRRKLKHTYDGKALQDGNV